MNKVKPLNNLDIAKLQNEAYTARLENKKLERENAKLQQRNAELESMMVEVNNNRTGVSPCARFCEALATKKMFDNLQRERDELAVQVELLRTAALNAISFMTGGETKARLRDAYDATPAQCLAEHDREVAARAGKTAYLHALNKYARSMPNCAFLDAAEQYANKIKLGEVEI